MLYWNLILRWELGVFQGALLLFASVVGGLLIWGADLRFTQPKPRPHDGTRPPLSPWAWARLLLYVAAVTVMSLYASDGGRPVGGLIVFDDAGQPQRATIQLLVRSGGKIKTDHVVLRAMGPGGSTRGLHRVGYGAARRPLVPSPTFWDGEALRSTETLAVVATADEVRTMVPSLQGVESKVLHSLDGGDVVFLRRDGVEVRVDPAELIDTAALGAPGCAVDAGLRGSVRVPGLIHPRGVPWPSSGEGCPSVHPPGVQLLVSDDAAFGEVHPLLTLRDGTSQRWQSALSSVTRSEDPVLLGAVPLAESLMIVAADGDDLVFSRLGWDDGVAIDSIRW